MRWLLLLFIVIPIFELWLLIEIGSMIGPWPTIALVFATALGGVALLRREGLKTLLRGHRRLEEGQLPTVEMFEGLALAVSGALLLTPGFFTDALGLVGLVPWSRRWLIKRFLDKTDLVSIVFATPTATTNSGKRDEQVIEAEFWRDEKDKPSP